MARALPNKKAGQTSSGRLCDPVRIISGACRTPPLILFALALPETLRPDYRRAWVFTSIRFVERVRPASGMQKPPGIRRGVS
jgi:hypothetical protein